LLSTKGVCPEINSKIIDCWFNHRVYGREAISHLQGDTIEPAVLNVKLKSALLNIKTYAQR